MIAYELAEGEPPYLRLPSIKAMYLIVTENPPTLNKKKYSKTFQDFVSKCLKKVSFSKTHFIFKDPKERLDA